MFKLLRRGFRLETKTDAGLANIVLIGLAFALALAVAPNALEQLIGIWSKEYTANFPILPVLGVLMGGGLVCVFLLVVLEPYLSKRRPPWDEN